MSQFNATSSYQTVISYWDCLLFKAVGAVANLGKDSMPKHFIAASKKLNTDAVKVEIGKRHTARLATLQRNYTKSQNALVGKLTQKQLTKEEFAAENVKLDKAFAKKLTKAETDKAEAIKLLDANTVDSVANTVRELNEHGASTADVDGDILTITGLVRRLYTQPHTKTQAADKVAEPNKMWDYEIALEAEDVEAAVSQAA